MYGRNLKRERGGTDQARKEMLREERSDKANVSEAGREGGVVEANKKEV